MHSLIRAKAAAAFCVALVVTIQLVTAGEAAAKSGGGRAHMTGSAQSLTQNRIDRVGETRVPAPTKAKKTEPCKGKHCNWQHQH